MFRKIYILIFMFILSACSTDHPLDKRVKENNYQTATLTKKQTLEESQQYRFFGDVKPDFLIKIEENNYRDNRSNTIRKNGEQFNILVLSGGGERGAYGAGVLAGLHHSGKLPHFDFITGVSAGALMAPFVYVGDKHFKDLKGVMLGLNDNLLLGKPKGYLQTLFSDAFAHGDTLYDVVNRVYDNQFIEDIATEYNKTGRKLLIGTTNFDSGRQVVWDLGKLAASDLPNKSKLIHQVLAASASIPGIFPPQFLPVYIDGKQYEEMHVDGGLSQQLFFDPIGFDLNEYSKHHGYTKSPEVYIIRNGALTFRFSEVKDSVLSLAARSVDNLILAQTRGDLYREFYISNRMNTKVNLTYVDKEFTYKPSGKHFFDKEYMTKLYQYGYDKAQKDDFWINKIPPSYVE
ncbi:patatin-like phospholipase family protein [Vibrio sp. SS-MA-C1-2]|uniref:patatin-like phospholipase family protein n=1 Tax=Vibrio sp. SS-MA-C1-2 TaxID=2908646 RepID=UPI001F2DCC07|nr:patatin-like phospholipase family protein [Vibrio sp. SS-MA-C1-2]UJF17303.1 patatin-like phospholipase family protein [Vibrio sp. SS-MA-C1-2]